MLRRLFTIVSALSLVLCAATVVLWVRSYRSGDEIRRNHEWLGDPPRQHRETATLASRGGHLMLFVIEQHGSEYLPKKNELTWEWNDVASEGNWGLDRFGFRFDWGLDSGDHQTSYIIAAPHWLVATGFLIPALLLASRRLPVRRKA